MPKLIVLQGLPGSGKTTYATQLLKDNSNAVRINKDTLRSMMHSSLPWNNDREKRVVSIAGILTQYFLHKGNDVIVDDTNLNPAHIKYYQKIKDVYDADFEIVEMDTPLVTCVRRDRERKNPVGQEVIMNMAKKYGYINKNVNKDSEFVIYMLDDVLADISYRRNGSGNIDGITGKQIIDTLCISNDMAISESLISLHEDIRLGFKITIISARPEYCRQATIRWLEHNNIVYDELILKPDNYEYDSDMFRFEQVVDHPNLYGLCKKLVDTELHAKSTWMGLDVPIQCVKI